MEKPIDLSITAHYNTPSFLIQNSHMGRFVLFRCSDFKKKAKQELSNCLGFK